MSALLAQYLDWDSFRWLISLFGYSLFGMLLGFVAWCFGWVVAWIYRFVRRNV